jgi:hypothetical protein
MGMIAGAALAIGGIALAMLCRLWQAARSL